MRRRTTLLSLTMAALALIGAVGSGLSADRDDARILQGYPFTLDPAAAGDAGSSALIAQLYETLTAFDDDLEIQPALASSWEPSDDGRRLVLTPPRRPDVLRWDAAAAVRCRPQLAARHRSRFVRRRSPRSCSTCPVPPTTCPARPDADTVDLRADDGAGTVTVGFDRPSADFAAILASPTFAVVPEGIDSGAADVGDDFVASGGYRLVEAGYEELMLVANDRFWAGPPAIERITVVTDLGGASPVAAFEDGEIDYAPISSIDASWIAWDAGLGPKLRSVASLSTDYYGFDTTRPPFDDVRVRQAFGAAVDWRRIAFLGADDPATVATSMVPPGIPGRSDQDFVPIHDPAAARALLADAGFPDGSGFPAVTLLTSGAGTDEAIATELERELGVTIDQETMDFEAFIGRLDSDPPAIWSLSWVADYPGRNDFLGVLLGTGSSNNYGRWSSPAFDAAIADAAVAGSADEATAAYDRAEDIVQDEVPVVPLSYGSGWALAADGLLGAGQNGLGSLRFAGLAWAP